MEPETMGAEIAEFEARQRDGSVFGVSELEARLRHLDDLSAHVHELPAGDLQASTAKLDELRRQYTQWLEAAQEQQGLRPGNG